MKKLVALTGAGISAESGIKTFRDAGGFYKPSNDNCSYLITAEAINPLLIKNEKGVRLGLYSEIRKPINSLSGIKSSNGLLYVLAARYARENNIPYLGICLGMQLAVIEFARHVANIANANSTEFDPQSENPVVALITEWMDREGRVEKRSNDSDLGGTMRLGSQRCPVKAGTLAHRIYGSEVNERHRHRYEVNNIYVPKLEKSGLIISARTPNESLPEMMELPESMHPWFFGVQFHPEFTSTPRDGHPLFSAFIGAALIQQDAALKQVA